MLAVQPLAVGSWEDGRESESSASLQASSIGCRREIHLDDRNLKGARHISVTDGIAEPSSFSSLEKSQVQERVTFAQQLSPKSSSTTDLALQAISLRSIPSNLPSLTTIGRLTDLIKRLWSNDATTVRTSMHQLQILIDKTGFQHSYHNKVSSENDELPDNTLELAVVRRGGHLAIIHALKIHLNNEGIQAMGWAALAWLCERCNVKAPLLSKGVIPLVGNALTQSSPLVTTEALYLLGHLCTLPKVAHQVSVRESFLHDIVLHALPTSDYAADESEIDAIFVFCQRLAAHQSLDILKAMWEAGCLKLVVRHMQEALDEWHAIKGQPNRSDEAAFYEDRLEIGCGILTNWAKTGNKDALIVRALIESGALTVAAELLRYFPAGTQLRKAANPCLRAMVPATED